MVQQVHCNRRRLLWRGLEFNEFTINKSAHTKKVWKLIECTSHIKYSRICLHFYLLFLLPLQIELKYNFIIFPFLFFSVSVSKLKGYWDYCSFTSNLNSQNSICAMASRIEDQWIPDHNTQTCCLGPTFNHLSRCNLFLLVYCGNTILRGGLLSAVQSQIWYKKNKTKKKHLSRSQKYIAFNLLIFNFFFLKSICSLLNILFLFFIFICKLLSIFFFGLNSHSFMMIPGLYLAKCTSIIFSLSTSD